MNNNKTFNLIFAFVFAFSLLGMPVPALAQEPQPNPSFTALFPWNRIDTYRWPMDANLILTIDDPDNGTGVDYTDTTKVGLENFNPPSDTWAAFRVNGFELQPGQLITVTDGHTIKTHVVQYVTVTEINPETDTIAGMATPGAEVQIGRMCDESGCAYRSVIANSEWAWLADLTSTGNVAGTQGVFDIRPGSKSDAFIADNDDDRTSYQWEVPDLPNPAFSVVPDDPNSGPANIILGWDFEVGTTVNLCIDNPPFDSECDYDDLQIVPSEPNGFAGYQFQFSVDPSTFQIMSGQRVQLDNGLHMEEHVVTNMRLLSVNWDTEQVSGTADPGSKVEVPAAGGGFYVIRRVTANDDGEWTADFAQPGSAPDEQEILDLRLGHVFFIPEQWDENGNSTKFWWQPPNPYFFVDFAGDHVYAFQWPVGAMVSATIDDPVTPDVDFSDTQPVRTDNPWSSETWIDFQSPIPFKSGLLIIMTDGNTIKTHTVTALTITKANSETDTVSGTATPGALVRVWIHDPVCCIMRHVVADENGLWTADYSVLGDEDFENETFDLQPGNSGQASQPDEDTDATNKPWQVPNPSFSVLPDENNIEGNDWPPESILTINVGDPDNADYTTTTTVNPADLDHSQTWFKLDLADDFNLQPGQTVTVSDTTTTKQTIIVPRNITLIDLATDTIAGEAEPNIVNVVLWACDDNGCGARYKDVNPDGSWSVNFAEPGEQGWENVIIDIQPDTSGGIYQGDVDGDGTTYLEWSVLNQLPVANAGLDQIVFAGKTITLDASASSDPEVGALTYAWDLDNDGQYDDASGVTATTSFIQPGDHEIGLQVTDDGGLSDTDTTTVTVLPWTLKGFYQPVDMNGVVNVAKNGSTMPLKFEVFAGSTELTDVTYIMSLTYALTTCDTGAVTDEIGLTATGGTSLLYANGQFIYNWKTPKTAGKCYRVIMTTIDGSSLVAYFKLK